MKLRHVLFCLVVIASIFAIRKIPFEQLFNSTSLSDHSKQLKKIISDIIVIAGCIVCAAKYDLLKSGGFKGGNSKNYWMLLLPLFYPGAMFFSNYDASCLALSFSIIVTITSILIRGLLEESVFRGVIHGYIIKQNPGTSVHRVCLLTAIFFALVHFSNLQYYEPLGVVQQIVYAFFLGLLLSGLQFRVRNIWLLGIVHGLLNLITSSICKEPMFTDGSVTNSFTDYLSGIGLVVLLMSPLLFFYWLVIRTYKTEPKNH
jgi:membrane protease YdiL (CAAX protease family)